jgi:hypothetical protein
VPRFVGRELRIHEGELERLSAGAGATGRAAAAISRAGVTCRGLHAAYDPDDLLGAWAAG